MTTDKMTTWIAAGAIASPAWLPSLQTISQIAGLLLPIVGVIWLTVQIFFKVRDHRRGKPKLRLSMNRAIFMLAAFVAAFTLGLAAEAAECGRRDNVVKFLADNFDESRRAVALANSRPLPLIAELFVSEAGTWTLTLTNPEGFTCLRASGHNWEPVREAPAFIGPHSF